MVSQDSAVLIVVIIASGPLIVVWGLSKFNETRFLENTPRSKVRSAAMGLVELYGMARLRKQAEISAHPHGCLLVELPSPRISAKW